MLTPAVWQRLNHAALQQGLSPSDLVERLVWSHLGENDGASGEGAEGEARDRIADDRLAEANRARDEFLAVLSHELRTPLNPIVGWSQLLRRGVLGPGVRERALEAIERNARLQSQLIEDLLDVSRMVQGSFTLHRQVVDPLPAVRAAVEGVRALAAEKGVTLIERCDEVLPAVEADAPRLTQALWHLLANAVKFTPEGGEVELCAEAGDGELCIAVRDSGIGIAPELLPLVFERFYQGDSTLTRAQGGLGLGLAIVQHIVALHGGSVRAESAGLGTGSRFVVALPASPHPHPLPG